MEKIYVLILFSLLFLGGSFALAQSTQPCTNYYAPGTTIPSGYAPPWDLVFSSGQLLVQASCAKSTLTLDVGRRNTADYVCKLANLCCHDHW
jgi:hypothetical protein